MRPGHKRTPEVRVGRYLGLLVIPQARLKAWRKLGMGVPRLRAAWRRGEVEGTELVRAACAVLNEDFGALRPYAMEDDDPIMAALAKLRPQFKLVALRPLPGKLHIEVNCAAPEHLGRCLMQELPKPSQPSTKGR